MRFNRIAFKALVESLVDTSEDSSVNTFHTWTYYSPCAWHCTLSLLPGNGTLVIGVDVIYIDVELA